LPIAGAWIELLNTDDSKYGGSHQGVGEETVTEHQPSHGRPQSIEVTVPPLAVMFLAPR
jgi:1,4-alpha-glucan branching enzyme